MGGIICQENITPLHSNEKQNHKIQITWYQLENFNSVLLILTRTLSKPNNYG